MEKNRIFALGLIALLLVAGLILAGCKLDKCSGSGNCTVTIDQGVYGLYIDTDSPRSSCGKTTTSESNGCKVADMNYSYSSYLKYGTHGCDC